ncbi:DNA methylase N-4/N-6 domain protein [Methanocaldococcus sp. FS406-22]|uniref:DNA methyltransferase n=1 Tax=Methanocaldococcus sp. (strain FS406-22) TaxID=644281 RepID=UPI0001BF53C3|nr:DNA methyltransferase [Methanocaldococcus sp. FS406-22]ADC69581.1 DNA methylase N-4/N-6 domain protein [Methanocaldococcus sp. FS406-22]
MEDNIIKDIEKVKNIEGFPLGDIEDIVEISNPPEFTLYPNPYIEDFIKEFGKSYDAENDDYQKTPYVSDVSEGKNDPIYNAHTYHTKVPYKAIMKFIKHYTEPGDIVFDGFCGSGMTGVAALMTGRHAILNDLSPVATFIAYNFTHPVNPKEFKKMAEQILKEVEEECGWMYKTKHDDGREGVINYVVWSDVFRCPNCGAELVFWDIAVDFEKNKVKKEFICPSCEIKLDKRKLERVFVKKYDSALGKEIEQAKQVPVLINYKVREGKKWKTYEKTPDDEDLKLIEEIEKRNIPYWYPTYRMPEGYNTEQPKKSHGVTHVHHFYTKRNLWCLASFYDKIRKIEDKNLKYALIFWFTSALLRTTKMYRWNPKRPTGFLSGTLYIPSIGYEFNIIYMMNYRIDRLCKYLNSYPKINNKIYITTQSSTDLRNIPDNSIDYIFVDPPFGDNLMYSELNFIWESWLRVFTNNKPEAIINETQNKDVYEYKELMYQCFKEMYRILKPNRWITIEFHNSKAKVWNAIQEALSKAGFIIAMVSTLDKKQKTFKQITGTTSVATDLIINAYKPKKEFEERFLKSKGKGFEKEFVEEHLQHLPLEPNIERTDKVLYSRMLAYYVQHGYEITMDSEEFYEMLKENFINIDGYWYTIEQADKLRKEQENKLGELLAKKKQLTLFITNEEDALLWLWNFLKEPKTYSEIYTNYTKFLGNTEEDIPELEELLRQNFIEENGKWRRPTEEEKKSLEKKKRDKLLREFNKLLEDIKAGKIKAKIKNVKKSVIVEGFKELYKKKCYEDIILVAEKLPTKLVEEDEDISMFVDIAYSKLED